MPNDKTRGRESPFTEAQRIHIRDHYQEWERVLSKHDPNFTDSNNKDIQKWRDATADTIMRSDLFAGKLSSELGLNAWEKKIRHCFSTERTRLKRIHTQKGASLQRHDPQACASQLKELAKALLAMRTFEVDARTLFRERNDAAIRERAADIVAANPGAAYQKAHSELWKNANKEFWESELRNSFDVQVNREQFPIAMFEAMKAVSQLGTIGHAEMILLYGVRGDKGQLEVKTLHTHSLANKDNEAFDLKQIPRDFADWCEIKLPSANDSSVLIGPDEHLESEDAFEGDSSLPAQRLPSVKATNDMVQSTITKMFPTTKHAGVGLCQGRNNDRSNLVPRAVNTDPQMPSSDASLATALPPSTPVQPLTPVIPSPSFVPIQTSPSLPASPQLSLPLSPTEFPMHTPVAPLGVDEALSPLTATESDAEPSNDRDPLLTPLPTISKLPTQPAPNHDHAVRKSRRLKGEDLKVAKAKDEAEKAKSIGGALKGHRGYFSIAAPDKANKKRGTNELAEPAADISERKSKKARRKL